MPILKENAVTLPQIPLDDPRVLALAKARQQLAHDAGAAPAWEELTDAEREGALPTARNYLESAINAGLIPAVTKAPGVTAMVRDYQSGQPIPRDDYEAFLRKWMDREGQSERLPLLNGGEASVVAALLDELFGVYPDELLGRLAREMAVRLNDRLGI